MKRLLIFIAFFAACSSDKPSGLLVPAQLTCEYLKNPGVVDVANPRFAWINTAPDGTRGQKQTAWQVRVATSVGSLASPDLWDSGKTESDESIRVQYKGKPLVSGQECWWQVRVWDKDGNPTAWSEPGFWRMGLLDKSDWKAKWIGAPWQGEEALPKPAGAPSAHPEEFGPPAPMLRKVVSITKEIQKATAFVTGLGYFEFYVNGEKVSDDVLVPNQTNYGKRPNIETSYINLSDNFRKYKVMYLAYDITEKLNNGENAIGVMLGNGFYNPAKFWCEGYGTPRFLGQVHIMYSDGSEEIIASDETWKIAKSPILRDMVYYGEVYDAREEKQGWNTAGFDDSSWENAALKAAPFGELVAHTAHPDKVTKRINPVSIEKLGEGNYKVDFGIEISGWVKLINVNGPAGHQIDIAFNANEYSGDNTYICSGTGPVTYAPRFNWFVFSGIEIKNWPGELKPENLVAEAVNTYIEPSATFETSNTLFNQINTIWRRSQEDNMHGGIASDCPHRERSGYTGDGQVACPTVMANYDAKNFYHKWVQDMFESQDLETGYVPNGAPWQPGCGGGVAWGAAICIIPWEFYINYGALDMLKDNYPGMTEYIRYMQTWVDADGIMFSQRKNLSGEVLKWFNLGEWVAPGATVPDDLVHTFYFWYCADIASKTAGILGKSEEATLYRELAEKTRTAFHNRFYNSEKGSYGDGGGNVFALKMGVPEDQYIKVTTALKNSVAANNGHLDTGIFGTRFFFEVLAENGMNDLAYEALNKTTEPSFGHWIELGSTTSREQWSTGGSHNHPMFGGGLVWFYRNLAGMQPDPEKPGFRHIIFKPQVVESLGFVTYTNNTPYGESGITWKLEKDQLSMDVMVPVGCTATVYVPAAQGTTVTESGVEANSAMGVKHLRYEDAFAVYEVESGVYGFAVK
ncbi:MAG: family 78 glycoside hydrolase catalytic domain [Cyclobacteriaceae bacterium]|nr:family 78 glycoside hydrolase catalytic domain [Cyclobacteriaceae bacterium]